MLRRLALLTALAFAPMAYAAPWTVDKSHASISFTVDHLGFSQTIGLFESFEMEIDFDPENVAASTVRAVIDTDSINTFWAKRDEHIRGGDFLDTGTYPQIIFESSAITPTGPDSADVSGTLTMLGETQPVTFQATLRKLGPSPFNPNRQIAGMQITGAIDRTAFGMGYGAPAIGTVIPVTINLEMSPAN